MSSTSFNFHSLARRSLAATAVASTLFLGACAGVPPPVAEMATARTSVSSAESAGALQQAPTEYLSAREKLARAETASHDKNYAEARRLAEEATADADVAERKSRAVRAAQTADELSRANRVLSNELNRSGKP